MNRPVIGIARPDATWERRAPLTPDVVRRLCQQGLDVKVQPSPIRVFIDDAYRDAGATISRNLSDCDAILAVKSIPVDLLQPHQTYVYFSHTIKGQAGSMPQLRKLMDLGATLIDYERIVDDKAQRLVFFSQHAGFAGMVDTLHVLGRRLEALKIDSPFSDLKLTHQYQDLSAIRAATVYLGERIKREQVPVQLAPFICGFTGDGKVSSSAQEIYDLLPVEELAVQELAAMRARKNPPRDRVFKVVFREQDLVEPVESGANFQLQDYYDRPQGYRSVFERHVIHLSMLINGIYWTERYPRLLTRAFLKHWFRHDPAPRLFVVGDISCDIGGSVQCTMKSTTPALPAYVYRTEQGDISEDITGPGLAMMTTDCLPCELPAESSVAFAEALFPFVPAIAQAKGVNTLERSGLPPELKRATILWRGELPSAYRYLTSHVQPARCS